MAKTGRRQVFVQSGAAKMVAVLSVARGTAGVAGIVWLIYAVIKTLENERFLEGVIGSSLYGFLNALTYPFFAEIFIAAAAALIFIFAIYALTAVGSVMALGRSRKGTELCVKCCTVRKISAIVCFAFYTAFMLFGMLSTTGENDYFFAYFLLFALTDAGIILDIRYLSGLKKALDDVYSELAFTPVERPTFGKLRRSALILGIWMLAVYFLFDLLFIFNSDSLYGSFIWLNPVFWYGHDYLYPAIALCFLAAYAAGVFSRHIAEKQSCKQKGEAYLPSFKPFFAVLGMFALGYLFVCEIEEMIWYFFRVASAHSYYSGVGYYMPDMICSESVCLFFAAAMLLFILALRAKKGHSLFIAGGIAFSGVWILSIIQILLSSVFTFPNGSFGSATHALFLSWCVLLTVTGFIARARAAENASTPKWLRVLLLALAIAAVAMSVIANVVVNDALGVREVIEYAALVIGLAAVSVGAGSGRKNVKGETMQNKTESVDNYEGA